MGNFFTNIKMMIYDLSKLYYIFCRILIKNGLYRVMLSIGYTLNNFFSKTKKKKPGFLNLDELQKFYEGYRDRIKPLFENDNLQQYILGSFSDLWKKTLEFTEIKEDKEIYSLITKVSIVNAVLAGIPGRMAIGVLICIALETYMGLAIARKFGIKTSSENESWEKIKSLTPYVTYFGFVLFVAFYLFKHTLIFLFSFIQPLFYAVPFLPFFLLLPSIEYALTTFVGIVFKTTYEKIDNPNKKILKSSISNTKNLLNHQQNALRSTFNRENINDAYKKLKAWFTGDFVQDLPKFRGDVFVSASIGFLLVGKHDAFGGPVGLMFIQSIRDIAKQDAFDSIEGQAFIQSIRDRWPKLEDASVEEISSFMSFAYEQEQLGGVISLIKGKLFENLSVAQENEDGDEWKASLHEKETFPGSDMIMTNSKTGETIELSLKATDSPYYIESSLLKYPEIPILATREVSEELKDIDLDMLIASDFKNSDLQDITESNFEELINNSKTLSNVAGATATGVGVSAATTLSLWPFVVAYKRKKISPETLKKACKKIFPKAGEELVKRIFFITTIGPLYAWYVIAKTVIKYTPEPKDSPQKNTSVKYLAWKKK